MGGTSRISREAYVRFCEGLAVKFPGAYSAEPADCSGGVRHGGGVSVVRALVRNVGTCCPDAKGEIQVVDPQG